jgi:hypothetical protein
MDDESQPIEGSARFGRPYVKIAAVVALATAVLGVGILGPHTAGGPAATPAPSPFASSAPRETSAAPTGTAPEPTGIAALTGLARVQLPPGAGRQSWLPTQISSRSMAAIGFRLFYIVESSQVRSTDIGNQDGPATLVSVPHCQTINQLAAAGHTLAYVVTMPVGASGGYFGCGGPSKVAWSVWLLDLRGGSPRRVAAGATQAASIDDAEFPIRLALTESAYAFDRPTASNDPSRGETVEVHSLDGKLMWTSVVQAPVAGLMLGGGELAVLTGGAGPASENDGLWVADERQQKLLETAEPASSAALSSDGAYLSWDLRPGSSPGSAGQSAVGVESLGPGRSTLLTASSGSPSAYPLRPAVASTSRGPLVAWFATTPAGSVYPAFRYASDARSSVLPSVQEPAWLTLEGSILIWVTEASDGWSTGAFAVDLSQIPTDH